MNSFNFNNVFKPEEGQTEAFCWYIPKAMPLSINSYLINLSKPQSKWNGNKWIYKKETKFIYIYIYKSLCFAYDKEINDIVPPMN